MLEIRSYRDTDAQEIEVCFRELQSFEKSLEANRADGEAIDSAYRKHLLEECQRWDGCILVAELEGQVAGFACVLAHYDSGELIEAVTDSAYITDLVVLPKARRKGIGPRLLQEAEAFAKQHGAAVLRVDVLARNISAQSLYSRAGFRELELGLVKALEA